jgi:hypothetical protein
MALLARLYTQLLLISWYKYLQMQNVLWHTVSYRVIQEIKMKLLI